MQRLRNLLLISTALMPLATSSLAGPSGGTVVGGSATINGQGSANVTINQSTDKAIINWTLFNIGAGEKTTFNQPGVNSITLNKVTGGMGPSEILGTLTANGKVFIVNRDGIIFGPGAVITTSGFLATTSDIKNEDFMAGRFNFNIPGRPDASIVNMGTITATNGGFAALVAPGVRNTGTITADLGTIGLAAGNTFSLDFYGDRLITLGVGDQIANQVKDVATGQTLKSLVTNEGKLKANGGRVELTAASARVVVDSVINTSGVIEANSVGTKNGQIVLSAATGAPPSSGTRGQTAVAATNPPQKIKVSGTLSAAGKEKGTKGGSIVVSGEHIELAGASIDASGSAGGGKVMIGGDWGGGNPNTSAVSHPMAVLEAYAIPNATTVSVDAATKIDASAKDGGNGGKVIVWADQTTSFAGTILALGGATFGNGGFAEVSSKGVLNYTGVADLRAPNGMVGTLLLDPEDITIWSGTGPTPSGTAILNTTVQNQLASANVTIATNNNLAGTGDISVTAPVAWSAGTTLTLSAFKNINLPEITGFGPTPNLKNTGAGNVVLHANNEGSFPVGSGDGIINMPLSTTNNRLDWSGSSGTVTVFYNPASYATPTNFTTPSTTGHFTLASPSQLTAYMLVNKASDLPNIATNLSGTYALSKDIDGLGGGISPIGSFSGVFDGQNHTISHFVIPSIPNIGQGLFTAINSSGKVLNLNLDSIGITPNPNPGAPPQFIGVLAGQNFGLVSNVVATNSSISTGAASGALVGGLIGQNQQSGVIQNSQSGVNVSVGNAISGSSNNNAGGLVGVNLGTITLSSASGNISGGANSFVGGLVGNNGTGAPSASINLSTATGSVSLGDSTGSGAGGLVGFNFGSITNSTASGNVTGGNSSDIFKGGNIGGLVGLQQGGGASINTSFASGDVTGGSKSSVGGLVGSNNNGATITGSGAIGMVSSTDNQAGGLVGFNGVGSNITNSFATGNVSGGGFGAGGLVGDNSGTITNSFAFGNVINTAAANPNHDGDAGGFAGNNSGTIIGSAAFGNVASNNSAGGFAGSSGGTIDSSFAGLPGSTVTVGNLGHAGGFAAHNGGKITNSQAFADVTGGSNAVIGAFAAHNGGLISDSSASGSASATGSNSVVGGFAGVSDGKLVRVTSSGPVNGTSDSYLGGLVGVNFALIQDSTSSSKVTGSGGNNVAGGLVGINFGSIDPSSSSGNVSSGPNSIVGGFVGVNGALRFPDGSQFIGTISPDSSGTGGASGGSGSTTGAQVGQQYPTAGLPTPPTTCDHGGTFCNGVLFDPNATEPAQPQPQPPDKNVAQVAPLINITETLLTDPLTEKKQDDVVPTGGGGQAGQGGQSGGPTGQKGNKQGDQTGARPQLGFAPYGLGPLPSGMPPLNETRFLDDMVAFQIGGDLSDDDFAALVRRLKLTILYQERIGLLGRRVVTFRLAPGQTVRGIIPQLQALGSHFSAQPVYQFQMVQNVVQTPSPADTQRKGDSAQYIVEKLGLTEAHLIATGKDVKVAVIDSEIDARHPDLEGAVTANYDALPSDDQTAHPHGTGMAGAIASHQRLLGVAPGAKLLAVRAFGVNTGGAQGTSMNIVKGLQWAVDQGAKVINMSFAGPRDPILQQAMQRLTDQGIILIAAAGNAGPKSAPLYPGADPNVIAVSATDVDDKTYKNANRGKYVAIAAPGVDILVPAPEGGYQLTTGTSVAAAHISGVVALMLERNKALKPAEVRAILTATAKKTGGAPAEVGAGLVDPVQALAKSGPKQAQAR